MQWLDHYTFPREAQMQDLKEAKAQYTLLANRLVSNGTTTAMVFGSLHLEPTQLLADILHQVRMQRTPGVPKLFGTCPSKQEEWLSTDLQWMAHIL